VRYHETAKNTVRRYGGRYHGWLANAQAPESLSPAISPPSTCPALLHRMLPGIPTIRPFEALACGIRSFAPWEDSENLFRVGEDFLMVSSGAEMAEP
jgi:spore maturation protein CgeB